MNSNENIPWIEKYQPKNLNDIYGNKIVIDRFKNILKNKNMKNIIINGPPGIGKTCSIRCLLTSSLKDKYKDAVLELNGSEDRGINAVRTNIKSFAQKKVLLEDGLYKNIILDEADSITVGSQQALRRIIEKYSNNTRFIFISNDISKIIEAIQSRCTILNMNQLENNDIIKLLVKICTSENIKYAINGLEKISDISEGDMRQAINNLQNTYYCFKQVNLENVIEICDISYYSDLEEVIELCKNNKILIACNIIKKIYHSGYSCEDIINILFEILKKNKTLDEELKINYIKEISLSGLNLNEGNSGILQLYGILTRFCLKNNS